MTVLGVLWIEIKTFFQKHRKIMIPLGLLLLFALGFGSGLMAKPAKILTKEKVVTKTVDHVVYQDRIVKQVVYKYHKRRQVHKEITIVKAPDGTTTTKEKEDINTNTNSGENKTAQDQKVVYKDRIVQQIVEKTKLIQNKQPSWRVSAGVGISVPTLFLGKSQIGVPDLRGAVIQAGISRKLVGPLWFDVWGNTQGTVGLGLSGQF